MDGRKAIEMITKSNAGDKSLLSANLQLEISMSSVKRWRRKFNSDSSGEDGQGYERMQEPQTHRRDREPG